MATVDHAASLVIGQKAKFIPIPGSNISTVHFKFANYDTLKGRIKNPKLLTGTILVVLRRIRYGLQAQGKPYGKLFYGMKGWTTFIMDMLISTNDNTTKMTSLLQRRSGGGYFMAKNEPPHRRRGSVRGYYSHYLHNGVIQLESTYLTTAVINPKLPQTPDHVNSITFNAEGTASHAGEQNGREDGDNPRPLTQQSARQGKPEDDDDVTPNFKYSVNARITDETGGADAVFFNDSMYAMLQITCNDMVTKHGETDPKKLPRFMESIMNTPWLLHLAQKIDGSIVVNDVTKVTAASDHESETHIPGTSTFTPTTPTPKKTTSKRQEAITPDASERRKAKKA
ncbi:hypothetical protein CASFOL_040062 [Castilleja foliolosa]|uniref:Uncharacterized protein n=1 Tax=Castilleja foliolosa TaxID=1961234 RepID=A0ABD3BEX5_9LAMI